LRQSASYYAAKYKVFCRKMRPCFAAKHHPILPQNALHFAAKMSFNDTLISQKKAKKTVYLYHFPHKRCIFVALKINIFLIIITN